MVWRLWAARQRGFHGFGGSDASRGVPGCAGICPPLPGRKTVDGCPSKNGTPAWEPGYQTPGSLGSLAAWEPAWLLEPRELGYWRPGRWKMDRLGDWKG